MSISSTKTCHNISHDERMPSELERKMRTARIQLSAFESALNATKSAYEAAKQALDESITAAIEEPSVFITVDDAARLTSTSRETIYRLVRSNRLKIYKFGSSSRIRRADIENMTPTNN